MKKLVLSLAVALTIGIFAGCGEKVPANTVFSVDDLTGKKSYNFV